MTVYVLFKRHVCETTPAVVTIMPDQFYGVRLSEAEAMAWVAECPIEKPDYKYNWHRFYREERV